jgi:phosphoglucomutase
MATQGLCNYLLQNFKQEKEIKVALAHDSRNNSRVFAEKTAEIFSANGIKVYLFDSLRPVPELSFTIRHLGCQSGVVITASHNPKEYNGYKVYWEHGGQIIAPHDKNIVNEVNKISSMDEVKSGKDESLIEIIGSEIDNIYVDELAKLSVAGNIPKDIRIVYTAIHGAGVKLVPMVLKKFGFTDVNTVVEQNVPDGNFPTVHSPNPEEPAALDMAIKEAEKLDADLVLGTDPDADRVGIAVKNDKGKFVLLNGNQTGSILIYYMLKKWQEIGKLNGKEYIVKTIVTTELQAEIAGKFKVKHYDVLTGFKYIADIINNKSGKEIFIAGGEESYGYLAGEFVRDKDAVMASALIAEAAAWAKSLGKSMFDLLLDIYNEFSFYKEDLVSLVKKGKSGVEEIQKMMTDFRANPPKSLNGSPVEMVYDYQSSVVTNLITGDKDKIDLPKSNVLQFLTQDGTKISVRPSGTEPKIKFYFSVKGELKNKDDFYQVDAELVDKINNLKKELALV